MAFEDQYPGLGQWLGQAGSRQAPPIDANAYLKARPDLAGNWSDPVLGPELKKAYGNNEQAYLSDFYWNAGDDSKTYPAVSGNNGTLPAQGTPAAPTQTPPTDFNQLVNQSGGTSGNIDQTQVGSQTGSYNSSGTNTQTQAGNQQTQQNTNSTQNQTANQSTNQNTNQSTNVSTPFDIQSLIGGELNTVAKSDKSSNDFLTNFMQTGGDQFNSQVDQAVRQAGSGPGLTGAGDSSKARAAGYAAADVARNNAGQRLQAAQQLNSGTGLGALNQQSSPLYGSSSTGNTTGATTDTSATTGTGSTTGSTVDFQSLVNKEAQSGTATGDSIGKAFGVVPVGTTQSSGGCMVCTAYVSKGWMKPGAVRRAVKWKLSQPKYSLALRGYAVYGPILSGAVLDRPWFAKLFFPTARAILYHEVYLSAPNKVNFKLLACIQHSIFNLGSLPFGIVALLSGRDRGVHCSRTVAMLESQKLNFVL